MSTQKPATIADLHEIIEYLTTVNSALEARISELEAEIVRLRKDPPAGTARVLPSFVRPNRVPKDAKPRKKRDQPHSRRREKPTTVVVHTVDRCPDCGRKLSAGWEHSSRQVVDIPVVQYEVTEHRMMRHHCGACKTNHLARPDLSGVVLGASTIGVRLMSLIASMKTIGRMPTRTIRDDLKSRYGLAISTGQVSEVLHRVAAAGEEHYSRLLGMLRTSDYVHADETSWREDGQNGYVWCVLAPGIRYFERNKSRGHQVPEDILGSNFPGILVSDFYGGYNFHMGLHQRCWVHYQRDLHELKEKHADDAMVVNWVTAVNEVYTDAKAFAPSPSLPEHMQHQARVKAREQYQERLLRLGEPYAKTDAKQSVMAQRITRFSSELFTFVEHPQVPSENNAAERAIRPSVIDRKVTGGTRSEKGSHTKSVLMSLFRTWEVRQLDMLETCRLMLVGQLKPG